MYITKRARLDPLVREDGPGLQEVSISCAGPNLLSLPPVIRQLIMMSTGRGGRGAYVACKTLHDTFNDAARFPDMFGRYCLSIWGPTRALSGAFSLAPAAFRGLPERDRVRQLRAVLKALVEAGAELSGDHIQTAITGAPRKPPSARGIVECVKMLRNRPCSLRCVRARLWRP
jgi:hypothetical protein